MRKEPFFVGSYVHVIKRGARGLPLVKDAHDRHRFLLMLRYFNTRVLPENWFRDVLDAGLINSLQWPDDWVEQEKIVEIICFCLVENHFHLLLKEIVEGGIVSFMHRLGTSMTNHFNEKYHERGSLFQGAYRSKTIDTDEYLQHASAYIQVKNCFEVFPQGYKEACRNFAEAFKWAQNYRYCSLGEFMGCRHKIVSNPDLLAEVFTPEEYQEFANDFIAGRLEQDLADLVCFE